MTGVAGSDPQDNERLLEAERRFQELLGKTAKREEILGRDAFLSLPSSLQNQMVVLQKQSEPKARTQDALVAAESNLREYNARIDDAFNLKSQIEGERGRRSRANRSDAKSALIKLIVLAIVAGGAIFFYRKEAAVKAEECVAEAGCSSEGLCSGKLSFTPFGMQCAAQGDDCRKATICTVQGMCSAKEGACFARSVEDCRRSKNCFEQGLCSPFAGTCVAGSGDDCQASRACHAHGACIEVGGRCIARPGLVPSSSTTAAASGSAAGPKSPRRRAAPKVPVRPGLRARP